MEGGNALFSCLTTARALLRAGSNGTEAASGAVPVTTAAAAASEESLEELEVVIDTPERQMENEMIDDVRNKGIESEYYRVAIGWHPIRIF